MSKLLYDELYELTINFDRHQFIKLLMEKDRKIQDLSTDKQQLNMLVNSCQNEIRKLKEQTNQEDVQQYISAKKSPVHSCIELSKYFIGKHATLPIYLTSQFENEFNSKMYLLEITQQENQELKKQLEEKNNKLNSVLDYIDSNIFIEQFENVDNENNVRKEIIKRITNDKEVE